MSSTTSQNKLIEIFKTFFKLGFVAFGGPAAHVSMMQDLFVEKMKWMSPERFASLLGITNLIPGPNSTEMAMLCGYERGGRSGFIIAGASFILPSMTLTILCAMLYQRYGAIPEVQPLLIGLQAGVVVVIINAVYKLARKALKENADYLALVMALVLNIAFLDEIFSIVVTGLIYVAIKLRKALSNRLTSIFPVFFLLKSASIPVTSSSVFLFFLKIGAVLFGSGYVLVAYLDSYLVQELHWLTRPELLDAIAIGQFTPGPVLTTASFIGYILDGVTGAILATLGIFLPSFLFVALVFPLVEKISKIKSISLFILGAGIGALGVMAVVAFDIFVEGIGDIKFLIIAMLAALYQFGFKKPSTIITILGSMAVGFILYLAMN